MGRETRMYQGRVFNNAARVWDSYYIFGRTQAEAKEEIERRLLNETDNPHDWEVIAVMEADET